MFFQFSSVLAAKTRLSRCALVDLVINDVTEGLAFLGVMSQVFMALHLGTGHFSALSALFDSTSKPKGIKFLCQVSVSKIGLRSVPYINPGVGRQGTIFSDGTCTYGQHFERDSRKDKLDKISRNLERKLIWIEIYSITM